LVPPRIEAEPVSLGFACRFAPPLARFGFVLLDVLLCDIFGSFGNDGTSAVTAEAPQWHMRQRGGIQQGYMARSYEDTDAPLAAQVQSFLPEKSRTDRSFCAVCLRILSIDLRFRINQKRKNARDSKNCR
jgi:hypothetical protein